MWEKRRQTYKKYPILNNLDGIITTDQAIKLSKVDKNLTKLFDLRGQKIDAVQKTRRQVIAFQSITLHLLTNLQHHLR